MINYKRCLIGLAIPILLCSGGQALAGGEYTVQPGDSLWKLSQSYGTTIEEIKRINQLEGDTIYIGQTLQLTNNQNISRGNINRSKVTSNNPGNVYNWPSVTYIVQEGDTVYSIAKKFGVSTADLLKFNYLDENDWLNTGEKIAISGYAPRTYTVFPNTDGQPAQFGQLVDWFTEGKYILKRGNVFTLVDVQTGQTLKVKMMGGYNHCDIEPLTSADTEVMHQLFNNWTWSPRPVVIFKDGMNIAGSLSGMPHSFDTITDNGVTGHFDLYLLNSKPHSLETSAEYVAEHYQALQRAAGK